MVQSFALVDITKKKYVSPHAWGRRYELCEFAFSFDTFAVLYELLSESPGRFAFVGDNAMDERDDVKRGLAPTNDEIDHEYRVLDTGDLRNIDGLLSLHRLGSEVARSAAGEQIDRSTLPGRVVFVNRSKKTFFVVDTKDVDQFTVAALVWFLVDTSTASADYIVDVDASARTLEDDELLDHHGGSWAYNTIAAMDDFVFTVSRGIDLEQRDATEDLRAVAAAFRRRNAPRDDTAPAATAHERIRALCDDFADKIQSQRLDLDALFQIILRSVPKSSERFDTVFFELRFLNAALLMALERWSQKGDDDALRVVEYALGALTSPDFDGERSTGGHLRGFGDRAVLFAKHCGVPRSTYKKVCSAFNIDEDTAYHLDLQYARLEQAGCLIVPGTRRSLRDLFPLPGSSEERDRDHLKTLVDTNRSLGNAKRIRRA